MTGQPTPQSLSVRSFSCLANEVSSAADNPGPRPLHLIFQCMAAPSRGAHGVNWILDRPGQLAARELMGVAHYKRALAALFAFLNACILSAH